MIPMFQIVLLSSEPNLVYHRHSLSIFDDNSHCIFGFNDEDKYIFFAKLADNKLLDTFDMNG